MLRTEGGGNPVRAAAGNQDVYKRQNNDTYDRYTFYRLLGELGSDSTPESGLMNLNYDNLDAGLNGALNVNGTASVTNFVPWMPLNFFTNAADRMLKAYTCLLYTSRCV